MTTDNPFEPGAESEPVTADASLQPVELDFSAIFSRAWEVATSNLGIVIGAILIPFLISLPFVGVDVVLTVASAELPASEKLPYDLGSSALNLVSSLISLYLQCGVIRIFWNLATGREASLGMILSEGHRFPAMLGSSILFVIAVGLGTLLLIVPGVILFLGLYFYSYCVIVEDKGPVAALQQSWELTHGHKVFLFLFNLVVAIGALALTCLTCGIGYLLVLPILALIQAVMFQSIRHLYELRME